MTTKTPLSTYARATGSNGITNVTWQFLADTVNDDIQNELSKFVLQTLQELTQDNQMGRITNSHQPGYNCCIYKNVETMSNFAEFCHQ